MTRKELLNKATYIQYCLKNKTFKKFDIPIEKIVKLPIADENMFYSDWKYNDHHFTTEYHRKYSIPLYCKLFNLDYNEDDFMLQERKSGKYDISFLKPKKEYMYEVYSYTRGEHLDNLTFDDITNNNSKNTDITAYHRLYIYSHECSRLINKTIENKRKLFISGDSQMIPDIPFLSCFFKEVWLFDNRKKGKNEKQYADVNFSDVLVELSVGESNDYLIKNFL